MEEKANESNQCKKCKLAQEVPEIPFYAAYTVYARDLNLNKTYLWCSCGLRFLAEANLFLITEI